MPIGDSKFSRWCQVIACLVLSTVALQLCNAANGGKIHHGTLLVMFPSKQGILVASDRLLHTSMGASGDKDSWESTKVRRINHNTILAVTGACIVESAEGKILYDVGKMVKQYFLEVFEFSEFDVDGSMQSLMKEFGRALQTGYSKTLNQLTNAEKLTEPFENTGEPMVQCLLFHRDRIHKSYEVYIVKLFPHGAHVTSVIELLDNKELFAGAPLVAGQTASVRKELAAKTKLSPQLRQYIESPESERTDVSASHALGLSAEIILLGHDLHPNDIGTSIDACLLTPRSVTIICKGKLASDVMITATDPKDTIPKPDP